MDFLFQTAYNPEKLATNPVCYRLSWWTTTRLTTNSELRKTATLGNDKMDKARSGDEGKTGDLSSRHYEMQNGLTVVFISSLRNKEHSRLELFLGTLNLRTTQPFCLSSSPLWPWRE